ncbi:MAG: DUF2235 domain-containing protein [Bradyrhizobiaceae bacterium]|nr:DUF2235 domain-containing protein [Bradyrhizobiaceae bacterium]
MSKNVVFCADGTWSGPNQPDSDDMPNPTNVLKLFENLDGVDIRETARQSRKERERSLKATDGSIRQIAKYLHGVGDSENFLVRVLGGALGAGLITRIVRGYTFLSRSYAAGDRIFIIGFSRGAYTARALAGLVAAKGLLDATKLDLTDKSRAYRLGAAVWYQYQRERLPDNKSLIGEPEDIIVNLPGFLIPPPSSDQMVAVPIEAVAVWDTVGALGIPEYNVKKMRVDSLQFIDRKLSIKVRRGLHAVAIDERRADFTPTLWDADPRATQVLFAGAHSDVGGGCPQTNDESGLSDGALAWMTGQLAQLGVQFSAPPAHPVKPDARGMAHRPWLHPPWNVLLHHTRRFPDHGLEVSPLVRERMAAGDVPIEGESARPYQPSNLPKPTA